MKRTLIILLTLLVFGTLNAQPWRPPAKGDYVIYTYRDTVRTITDRAQNGPQFVIYPNTPVSEAEAKALVEQLGLIPLADANSGSVEVLVPVNGKEYDKVKDLEAYEKFINDSRSVSNLKIIGLGRGATFVNSQIASVANEVAAIFTYGGSLQGKPKQTVVVPAYVAQGNKSLANFYIQINKAKEVSRDSKHVVYENADEPLQRVVLALDKKTTAAEALADAWETLLSKNYRYSNYRHTHYMGAKFGQYGPYELEPYTDLDAIGMKRVAHKEKLSGPDSPANKPAFWYEYMPEQCQSAKEHTVPLVVMLHGHQNDNRTQSETSGFVEIAAREGIALVEIEWQGLGGENASDMSLGMGGIEQVIMNLLKRYPQIDPSRVYCQGLSAGAMHSAAIGIEKSYLFAAVAGHSGGIFDGPVYSFTPEGLFRNARQKRGKVEMPFFLTVGTDDDTIGFPNKEAGSNNPYYNALNLYACLNDMPEVTIDFQSEPVLGILMENRETIVTNKHITLEKGELLKKSIPMIQFTAILHYGHWNFRPMAERMWNFFRHFSRNVETGELEYCP
jgi:hypothetical protein